MKENRMLPIGTETFRIFVDEAEDGVIRGRVSGGTLPEETLFRSLSRLILLLEEQMDTGGAPKASPIKCTETPTFELDILVPPELQLAGKTAVDKRRKRGRVPQCAGAAHPNGNGFGTVTHINLGIHICYKTDKSQDWRKTL